MRRAPLAGALVLVVALPAVPLRAAQRDAADCAAFWEGYARYADISAYLDGAADARADAERFRAEADPDDAGRIHRDARDWVLRLDAMIRGNDAQSTEVFERTAARCGRPSEN
ncbi:hypothetical protein [Roseivivax marinus]|jgi:hypothetical protein|uniref:hypothetical protein n=1 Tax=Roseivivax marinus TaxID=1379903 RepID=UPI00273DA8A3|nr:hypothetical protein [Roseivivax marinus]